MIADGVLSPAPSGVGRGGYPSMMGLLPPQLETHHALLPGYFSNPNCRLVMGLLVVDDEAVHLVHPAKSPKTSVARVCPQEKAEYAKDGMMCSCIPRSCHASRTISRCRGREASLPRSASCTLRSGCRNRFASRPIRGKCAVWSG